MPLSLCKRLLAAATAAAALVWAPIPAADAARLNMSYLYFGSTSDYTRYVDAADEALQIVSPSYFDLNPDGTLQLTDKIDPAFIAAMHDRGLKVVPFLSNHWDRNIGVQALANREKLVEQIANAVTRYKLDGVNIDIENVTETSRDAYTDLVRLVREALPKDKEVSVAVSANPWGYTKGWHGSYDYAALASYSDYLMIMAYDETSVGDKTPGPVASVGFMEKSIEYALKYARPDQIVLGLPFYGRYWKTDGTMNGNGIASKDIDALIRQYRGTTRYDEASQSQVSTITIRAEDKLPVVNYTTLSPGTYVIWHENDTSLKQKLKLVERYKLKGAGSWSLGQENPGTWGYLSLWLNGAYFDDAIGHWAKSEIAAVAYRAWMNGVSPGRFEPDAPLTRAQAAAILTRAMLAGTSSGAAAQSGFADVSASHWASRDIAAAKAAGIVDGVGGGMFEPERTISREEMAAMLARALHLSAPTSARTGFSDVSPGSWAYPYVLALTNEGVLQGYEPGKFRPDYPILRGQMAALMDRLASRIEKSR